MIFIVKDSKFRLARTAYVTVIALTISIAITLQPAWAADANIRELQTAAQKGHIGKQIELAARYFKGIGVQQDNGLAAHWYEQAAKNGDPAAQNQIAFLYLTGNGVPADPARAFHWYQLAAASGYVKAKVNMGVLYAWGTGVAQDERLAAQLFREAVEKGDGSAASYLGDMCYVGMGTDKDAAAAERWYERGAKLGSPAAEFNLASLFSVANGHSRDFPRAAALLRRSVASGYVPAMHALGLLLTNHPELAVSASEARPLLETASNVGTWKSTIVLGILARDGAGVPRSAESAYRYFQMAQLQGGEKARAIVANEVKLLEKKLDAERSAELTEEANAWHQEHQLRLTFLTREDANTKLFPTYAMTVADDAGTRGDWCPLNLHDEKLAGIQPKNEGRGLIR